MSIIKQAPKYRYVAGKAGAFTATADGMGVQVDANYAILLAGEKEGEEVQELKPNQLAKIYSGVGPRKFNALVGYNPQLAELAEVSMNPVLQDGEKMELVLRARKAFKLQDLDYIFNMWIIE